MYFTLIKSLVHHFITRQNSKFTYSENILLIFILLRSLNMILFGAHKSFKRRLEKHFIENRYRVCIVFIILVENCPKSKFHKVLLSMQIFLGNVFEKKFSLGIGWKVKSLMRKNEKLVSKTQRIIFVFMNVA